jgi:biotin transport system substrate-specific component
MGMGNIVIFIFGVSWLSYAIGSRTLIVGFLPFIPGGILKTAIAAALLPSGWKFVQKYKN